MDKTRKYPCYAVIFRSTQTDCQEGYTETAARMEELARQQAGFLEIQSFRSPAGEGVTISYWKDLPSIQAWKQNPEHQTAQQLGKKKWYENYTIEVARIESASHFSQNGPELDTPRSS
ncbi:MAG: antibiotic biosynthesis monooxygenase [Planctomycetes bacterium]|nr:antibiotic biosynthesis monooxygenase [Planctomycetota bacterium]MCH9727633.1 antibiotic biosynthesis monooxygenase [Planctomycetota bacterium]MCH9777387.1 antibiotic biosynthesis monooxygenase [Planctomycetota bacterium]MDF1742942.1 antibiotic biosynthesis monooxygenase [Gimesia sp.]